MKCLRIKGGKGEFSLDGSTFTQLDSIAKEDILLLLNIALSETDNLEMDAYNASLISNSAHKIIYDNLYEKFKNLITNKQQFLDDANDLYKDAYEQYREEDAKPEGFIK